MLAPWKERIKRDVNVIEDAVYARNGGQFEDAIREMVRHQLERLVVDVVVLTRQEEAKKH
jgi:hypothetical protein